MNQPETTDPLHGVTLQMMLDHLVQTYGWQELGERIKIRCFQVSPTIPSSLRFLRKTPWARTKVEGLYLYSLRKAAWKREKEEARNTIAKNAEE